MNSPSRLATFRLLAGSLFCATVLSAQIVSSGGGDAGHGMMRSTEGPPFSADIVVQHSKVLADGNRIDQETHGKIYRDSQGRTRTENEVLFPTGEKRQHILIQDLSQRVGISLEPTTKTAQIHHFPNPKRAHISHTTEPLGHMTIEGFDAMGTRWTHTTPANAIGNAQPLVSMREVWHSAELNTELVVKSSDPQNGETTRKLVNIQRGEPDPALFQLPADYTITDVPAPH